MEVFHIKYLALLHIYYSFIVSPSMQLTIAVLSGSKLEPGKLKEAMVSSGSSNIMLETRCRMQSYSNGKIFNCTSARPPQHVQSLTPPKDDKSAKIVSEKRQLLMQCGINSHSVGETCVCDPGYKQFPGSDLHCVMEEGGRCNFQKNECRTELTYMSCINNICVCEESDVYDPVTLRCRGRVGGLCYPGIKNCAENAECVNIPTTTSHNSRYITDDSNHQHQDEILSSTEYVIHSANNDIELSGRCECKEGFVESQDGLCKLGYGQPCSSSEQCDDLNLVCKEGLCSCPNSLQIYDLVKKACVSLVGAQCSDQPGGVSCVKNAYCKKANLKMTDGRCACREPMHGAAEVIETKMRTCKEIDSPTASSSSVLSSESAASLLMESLLPTLSLSDHVRDSGYSRQNSGSRSRVIFSDEQYY